MDDLLEFYQGDEERVGFILKSGEIVEVENISDNPQMGFDVSAEDIIAHADDAVATWHTHPDYSNNLSPGDADTFLEWPQLEHYIIGKNGAAKYRVERGRVMRDE